MHLILVPTDCSELSARALRYADRIAQKTGAAIVAVYGEEFSGRLEGEGIAASLASRDDLEWMEMPIRRSITELLDASLTPTTRRKIDIVDMRPEAAIVYVADRREADLIVMTTHERNRLMRAVLGSIADGVIRDTHRPELILREHNDVTGEDPIRRIVCVFRDSPASKSAIANASMLAKAFGAELVAVHAVQDEKAPEPLPSWFAASTDGIPTSMRLLGIGAKSGERIIAVADEVHADLIVLGTTHRRFSDDSGAPASLVVRTAHCPVLAATAAPE
jgi:nucleotide-binding universal stress UspA family protein